MRGRGQRFCRSCASRTVIGLPPSNRLSRAPSAFPPARCAGARRSLSRRLSLGAARSGARDADRGAVAPTAQPLGAAERRHALHPGADRDDRRRQRRPARRVGRSPPSTAAEEELARFTTQPGYRLELVAAEPLVQDPVAIDFDPDGRMYVVEMRAFMPNLAGTGEDRPNGRIVVLEDTNDDGRMDTKTVFLDSLVLPRSVKVLSQGVLVAETPNLWLARDTNGDGKADTKTLVRDDYGTKQSNPEHNANGLLWGLDNWIHNANYAFEFRVGADGSFLVRKTPGEGQWGVSSDEYGRLYRNSNEDPLRAELVPAHYALRSANFPDPRGVYEQVTPNVPVWPAHKTPAVNRGYREQTLRPADSTLAHYTSRRQSRRVRRRPAAGRAAAKRVRHRAGGKSRRPVRDRRGRARPRHRAAGVRALGVHHQQRPALPPRQPRDGARRHDVRRGHVPRHHPAPHLHHGLPRAEDHRARDGAADRARSHLARRAHVGDARRAAATLAEHAGRARAGARASQRLVADHGAAAPRGATRARGGAGAARDARARAETTARGCTRSGRSMGFAKRTR